MKHALPVFCFCTAAFFWVNWTLTSVKLGAAQEELKQSLTEQKQLEAEIKDAFEYNDELFNMNNFLKESIDVLIKNDDEPSHKFYHI